MIGTKVTLRLRMGAHDAHYAGELVDGARVMALFGDLATELLIRLDGDEGLFRAYESVEFLAPVYAGDYIEATAELVKVGNTSRQMQFEARKVITNVRQVGVPASAADILTEPVVVCRAIGTCVTPREMQRKPRALYVPQLPIGTPPSPDAVITPQEVEPRPLGSSDASFAEVVVTAAISLAVREIADEAARCREAGAAVIHLHVRDDDSTTTASRDRFADAIERIRKKTDCIVEVSTGGAIGMSIDERAQALSCSAEMATLSCGTLNFGDEVFINTRPQIRELAARLRAAGTIAELECYEVGHVEEALALAAQEMVPEPLHFQFVMGVPGGIGATDANLRFLIELVRQAAPPPGATWAAAAVGRHQQPMTELAMRLGGHVRVGLEGNGYFSKGVLAEGTAPLVARAASYARSIGRTPVPPTRARRLLLSRTT